MTASSDETAEALGYVSFYVVFVGVAIWLLVWGLRQRGATQGQRGTGKVVGGAIMLALVVLGTLGRLGAQQS